MSKMIQSLKVVTWTSMGQSSWMAQYIKKTKVNAGWVAKPIFKNWLVTVLYYLLHWSCPSELKTTPSTKDWHTAKCTHAGYMYQDVGQWSQKMTFWDCSSTSSAIYIRRRQGPGIHTMWKIWAHHFTLQIWQSGMQSTCPTSPAA